MCGRWYVDLMADDELTEYYARLRNKVGIKTKGEVFPSEHIMVIANDKKSNPSVFNMKWGYTIGKNLVFNARSETLYEKNVFIDGIQNRRCVIPANYYFEWHKDSKEKNKINNNESNFMYFLGIYRFENNEPVCTILTKEASPCMNKLHDRMPIIIEKEKINDWLANINVDVIIKNSINNLVFEKTI